MAAVVAWLFWDWWAYRTLLSVLVLAAHTDSNRHSGPDPRILLLLPPLPLTQQDSKSERILKNPLNPPIFHIPNRRMLLFHSRSVNNLRRLGKLVCRAQ